MSLPDTVFIFVLALIIFGPKKLPEIGRQLGRLVGEFRRASNEFKFQIEEELRMVDFNDQRSSQQTIAAPVDDTAQIADTSANTFEDTSTDTSEGTFSDPIPEAITNPIFPQDSEDPAENLPIGQHPNIDTLDTSELNLSKVDSFGGDLESANGTSGELKTGREIPSESPCHDSVLTITPAEGAQARTTVPYAATESAAESLDLPFPQQASTEDALLSPEIPAPGNSHTAPTEAEITHG